MRVVEQVCRAKMEGNGKFAWGSKLLARYAEIRIVYPQAKFIYIVRDGRDIAASRQGLGTFRQPVAEIAKSWDAQFRQFQKLQTDAPDGFRIVRYETLVVSPRETLVGLQEWIGVNNDEGVLAHERLRTSLENHSGGHLSGRQVAKAINAGSIGRWKTDLKKAEAKEFEAVAESTLVELGYL
jgi:hypothetical protein